MTGVPVPGSRAESRPVVLVVDDIAMNRELLQAHLEQSYDVRQARDGYEALEAVDAEEPDLILLDVQMPRLDGLSVCRTLKAHATRRLIPIVILTALGDRATRLEGIAAGADEFLTKPFDQEELMLRARVLLHERELNKKLDATESVLRAFARATEARDLYTIHHADRVGRYAREIARAHGLTGGDLEFIYQGGVLHDLGKIAIPDVILLKPGPLDDAEFALMRTHPGVGERICMPLRSTTSFLPILRHHHERIDGRGYPDHLAGDDIPVGARLVALGDAWDAMLSDRPYRRGLPREEALRRLRDGAGKQWDATFTDLFLSLHESGAFEEMLAESVVTTAST